MNANSNKSFLSEAVTLSGKEPADWCVRQDKLQDGWLLAHATDGVIWGRLTTENGEKRLVLSCDAGFDEITAKLDINTLEQARLFNQSGEIRVWRTEDGFNARWIEDKADADYFDDPHDKPYDESRYLLWGTHRIGDEKKGFTLVRHGQEGLLHAVPGQWDLPQYDETQLEKQPGAKRPLALSVRHYFDYDEMGQAYIALTRLVALNQLEEKTNASQTQ